MAYTVRQLARLAGVTPRTLHHYDAIGLLRPSATTATVITMTPDIPRGLSRAYAEDPRFAAFFTAMHPHLPGFFSRVIEHYVARMEGRS